VDQGAVGAVLLTAVLAFLVGSINPASLLARALGGDLRSSGSGNPGATNAGRVLGRKWGVVVLVLDVVKAYLPTMLALWLLGLVPALVAGLAVVLGHVFSPFLRGRGGKGVACAFGAILAVEPWIALGALVVFLLVWAVVSYVGIASVVVTGLLLVVGLLAGVGLVPWPEPVVGWWLVAVAVLVLWRHERNIRAWWLRRRRR
jgi:glycerol-3-phosphate acyltransferase PlsY